MNMTDVENLDERTRMLNYALGVIFVFLGGYLLIKAYKTLKGK